MIPWWTILAAGVIEFAALGLAFLTGAEVGMRRRKPRGEVIRPSAWDWPPPPDVAA